jgi:hypothetical protein
MTATYEDNFGYWEIDCPEEQAFFEHVKSQSVSAICQRCDRLVRLMSTKAICAPCFSALECGAPTSMRKYGRVGPKTASGSRERMRVSRPSPGRRSGSDAPRPRLVKPRPLS